MHPIKHLKTITHHHNLVMKHCFACGLYWQGLVHDWTKLMPVEFWTGAKYFDGTRSPNAVERDTIGYSSAWLHHKGHNKHHWQYWVDFSKGAHGCKMPKKYVAEMVCDRIAACENYQGEKFTNASPLAYYEKDKDILILHPETRLELEIALDEYARFGPEYCFNNLKQWVKTE